MQKLVRCQKHAKKRGATLIDAWGSPKAKKGQKCCLLML